MSYENPDPKWDPRKRFQILDGIPDSVFQIGFKFQNRFHYTGRNNFTPFFFFVKRLDKTNNMFFIQKKMNQ